MLILKGPGFLRGILFILIFYFPPISLTDPCGDNGTWAEVLVSPDSPKPSFILGGLFAIHSSAVDLTDRTINDTLDLLTCDCIYQETVLLAEAMIYAIGLINDNVSLLNDINLGYNILGSCDIVSENVYFALEEYSLSEMQELNDSAIAGGIIDEFLDIPVTAVIGPCGSEGGTPVANILHSFDIPIISHGATVTELSKRSRYPNFFRTVYSDEKQVEALADLCHSFNWTYVAAIGSDDDLGREGVEAFKKVISSRGMCLSSEAYYDMADETNLYSIINNLKNKHTKEGAVVNVALLFMEWTPASRFLKVANSMQLANITWLGVDHWTSDIGMTFRMIDDYLPAPFTKGTVSTQFTSDYVSEFHTYLKENLENRMIENKWLMHFYCDQCTPHFDQRTTCTLEYAMSESCRKKVDLESILRRQRRIPNVISSVYATAVALHNLLQQLRGNPRGNYTISPKGVASYVAEDEGSLLNSSDSNQSYCSYGFCERFPIIDNDQLIDSLSSVDFQFVIGTYRSPLIKFRPDGDLENASFEIVNFYEAVPGQCDLPATAVQVGSWTENDDGDDDDDDDDGDDADEESKNVNDPSQLILDADKIHWQSDLGATQPPVSYCYRSCNPGEKLIKGPSECCWKCEQCPPGSISKYYNALDCKKCRIHTYSSPNGTVCIPNNRQWIGYTDTVAIICITFCVVGEIMNLIAAIVCCKTKTKSGDGGYAMKTVLFVNFALAYLYPVVVFAQPTVHTCTTRLVMWQWLATSSLVAKFFMLTQGRRAALKLARLLGLVPLSASSSTRSRISDSSTSSKTFLHQWRCEICYVIVMMAVTAVYVATAVFLPSVIQEEDLNAGVDKDKETRLQSTQTMLICVPNTLVSVITFFILCAMWVMNLLTSSKIYRRARQRRFTSSRSTLTVSGQPPPRRTAVEFHASNLLWSGYIVVLVLIVVIPLYVTTEDPWSRSVFRAFVPLIIITLLLCVFALPRCWHALCGSGDHRRGSRDSLGSNLFVISNERDIQRRKMSTIGEDELAEF